MTCAVRTTCPYCGVGCGVLAQRGADGAILIRGDPAHPAGFGRLCSKGVTLGETLGLEGRLLQPHVHGQCVGWDTALTHVAEGFIRIIREHGADAVAFYVSGQLLTEDYYVANKLMKGFIGTANIDTNSRLCMASAVAGHRRAFGADLVPGCYEDFELADLIVLVGSNTAWCHPVLHQRMREARERRRGLRIVAIDPRRTPTTDSADLHVPIRAGTDVALFNGLLAYLHRQGCADEPYLATHTANAAAAVAAAQGAAGAFDLDAVARACGVGRDLLGEFYALFSRTERVVTAFSQGVNQSTAGTDKVNSIVNCHLLTGRIGRPGMGPFSLTGQPNAMGGREVGAMANMLAAHMQLEDPQHRALVQEFWRSPRMASRPGLRAVELFEAVHAGRVRALWIMATNPVVSLPDADRVRAALERCELVVVSDCVAATDTTALAQVLLPACAWGEKDGTVTNSERCISRQRAFLPGPGEAKPDWWIVCEVARRMGYGGFDYPGPGEIFSEHARLSAAGNDGARCFDIGGLAAMTAAEYDVLEPVQWPVRERGSRGTQRLLDGRFWHADGRARLVATSQGPPANLPDEQLPLVLNTGRVRDQWHSMTRTARSPCLLEHDGEPFVDLHGEDALRAGIREGELARVTTRWGTLVARARCSGAIARGCAFVPIHWSDRFASDARVGAVVNPAVDPLSGQPEFKHTPARIEPFHVEWHALLVSRRPLSPPGVTWWVRVPGREAVRYELAGRSVPADWAVWARALLGAGENEDYCDYQDAAAGIYRAAYLMDGRLRACLYVSRRPDQPDREWVTARFAAQRFEAADRAALLAGRTFGVTADAGPVVCSCFRVRRTTIERAIAEHRLTTLREVSERVRAGSSCGSCIPEIRAMLAGAIRVT